MEGELVRKDQVIEKLSHENNVMRAQYDALKTENQRLKVNQEKQDSISKGEKTKEKFDHLEKFVGRVTLTDPRRKKTPPKSPNENENPKKLKGSWINVGKERNPAPLVRNKSSSPLSLTKPAAKLKQTHLNFAKESVNPDDTFCADLEMGYKTASTKTEPSSPSRLGRGRVKKVLLGLKQTKAPKQQVENPFELTPTPVRAKIKEEQELHGAKLAEAAQEEIDTNLSHDSDLIMLPTQSPQVIEIFDSNDSLRLPLVQSR